MSLKNWILISASTLAIGIFHQPLLADEAPATVFMDEGEADFEMPKVEVTESKVTKPKAAAKTRGVANDDDEDKAATGTKGDAYDQLQMPQEDAASAPEKKEPTKTHKKVKDVTQAPKVQEPVSDAPATASADPQATEHQPEPMATEPAAAPAKKVKASKKVAAAGGGFRKTKDGDCVMYEAADKTSSQILVVKGSKKLWVEPEGEWFKAFHKKGSGYLAAECFE